MRPGRVVEGIWKEGKNAVLGELELWGVGLVVSEVGLAGH
jgi:hypothetical protein